MNRTHRTAFTLIELIAVVVILAVLAGVALPKYFDYSSQARESATKGALGGVRAGVANFYANMAMQGTARYPTLAELRTIGTVMQEQLPENPYNSDTRIRNANNQWDPNNPPVRGNRGWAYDQNNGKFWANSDTIDENTW